VQKIAKLSITHPGIARFRSDFDHMTLDVQQMFKIRLSRSQHDIMYYQQKALHFTNE